MQENMNTNTNNSVNEDVIEIDLLEILGLLLHRCWIIILCMIVFGMGTFGISAFLLTPQYESTTGIYVMSKQDNTKLSYSDTQLSSQLTKDYEELITTRTVLESVIEKCGLSETYEELKGRVSVKNASDTRILYITVKDANPSMAQYIANSIREVASQHITSVTEVEAVNVVDQANLPIEPSEPSIVKWTAIGMFLGFFISAAIIIIIHLADDTIKTTEDVEKYLGWSTLALIPLYDQDAVKKEAPKKKVKKNKDNKESQE